MALPEPTGLFPAPTGAGFPTPTAFNDPLFGVNPYVRGSNSYTGATIDMSIGLPDLAARRAEQERMAAMAQLAQLGLAPDTDPHTWTPEDAALQTDQAIAKIAAVNPEEAERLMQMRAPEEDDGDSFWDNLKEVAGDILAPGLELGGRILDLVSRTANIVPNLAFDAVDGGEFDFWGDIGGALSGDVRHNWNSVFQEMGWEGDGIGGFVRATLGFAGDIATDPLTWLFPSGAGVKAGEAAASTAKTAATRSTTVLEKAKLVFSETGDDLVKRLEGAYDEVIKGAQNAGWKLGDDVDERVWGLIGNVVKAEQKDVMGDLFTVADRTYRATRTRSFATWARKGSITLDDGTRIAGKELKSVLEEVVKSGAMKSRASNQWSAARQISSALGGVRFKGAIPFTSLRYISPAIPGSKLLGEKTIGAVARMAAGQSGMNRMVTAIANGVAGASWDDLKVWMEKGWEEAFKQNPGLVNHLRGRFKNLGSMFYSGSEQMGRLTAHLDTSARASRTGLAGHLAAQERTRIENAFNQFVRETAYDVKDAKGKVIPREVFLRDLESFLGVSLRQRKNTATPEQLMQFAQYLDWFPAALDVTDEAALDAWYWSLPKNKGLRERAGAITDAPIGLEPGADNLALAEAKLGRMKELVAGLSDVQREQLDRMNRVWDNLRNEAAKKDALLADVRMNYESVGVLNSKQALEWAQGSHPLFAESDFFVDATDAGAALRMSSHGVGADDVVAGADVVGVHLSRSRGGKSGVSSKGTGVRARLKISNPIVIDETEAATLSDEELLLGWREAADQAARDTAEGADAAAGRATGDVLSLDEQRRRAVQWTTDKLRKERPDADAVVYKRANGDIEVVVFDPANVKVVDETAANLVQERGFFHRTFTKDAATWAQGDNGPGFTPLMADIEAYLRRETIGMDFEEAEAHIRELLVMKFGVNADELPAQIWETNLLEVHMDYVRKTGEAIAGEMTGRAARRIVHLGDLAPAMFGASPREQKYEWMLSAGQISALRRADTKLSNAILKSHAQNAKLVEEQHARLAKEAEQYGLFQAMLEESLAEGVEVPDRIVAAARRYGQTVADAEAAIAREVEGIDDTVLTLQEHLDTYRDALEQVKDDPGVGHPQAGDPVRVVDLGDGRHRIQGWHFTEAGVPQADVRGIDMSSNGFHFGDFATAKARADIEMDAKGKTIGWRHDQSTWPTMEVDTSPPLTPFPDETNEAFMRRLEEQEPVTQTLPVEPDVYYDDVLIPVEAEGKFKGAAEGDTILTEGASEEGKLGMSFTGSARGESQQKAIDRAPLQAEGLDGALYANAVENEGVSVVVLEPGNVRVANGQREFQQAVKDGRVFRAPDGTVSTKRVAGSRRLVDPASATQQLDTLSARRRKLEGLLRSLETGADDVVRPNAPRGRRHKLTVEKVADGFRIKGPRSGVDDAWLKVILTPEGDLRIEGVLVPKALRGQGIAQEMYRKAAEMADEYGGRLLSDVRVSPDAERVWKALSRKGFDVTEEEGRFVLTHHALPSTRKVAAAAESFAKATAARAKSESKEAFAAGKRMKRLQTNTHTAMTEANRAYAEFHGAVSKFEPALVKVETAGNLPGMMRLRVPGLEGYAMPSYIAEEFHWMLDKTGIKGLRTAWRRYVMGPWKRWATYRWPGFHIRNFFGAWFNNWLGGVVEHDYVFSWRVNHARDGHLKWAERKLSADEMSRYRLDAVFGKDYVPTYAEVSQLLAEQGVGRANTMAVMGIGEATEAVRENYRAVGKGRPNAVRRAARKFDGAMRQAGSSVEDFHRVAAWGRGMASTNGDTYGARAFVMMRHGDYADLTGAEDFIRDLVPFYKWMRTNIPYQIRMLAENPGQLTMVNKAEQYIYDLQGIDKRAAELQQPEWMQQGFSVPIPDWVPVVGSKDPDALKFAMFDLPYTDLYNGLGDYLSSALPVARNFIESYGVKQQVFSGVPLTGEYKPLSGVFNLPGVRDILHTFGLTKRGEDGQEYMKDQVQNVLMAWPIFSRFRNFTESDPARVDARVGGLFSMLAGVGIRQGDFTQAELDFYYNEVRPLLDQYKSLGIQMPSVDDFQSAEAGEIAGLFGEPATASPFLAA